MPILFVMRHAAAQSYAAADRDRALTDVGRHQAAVAGRALAALGAPDTALVSTARRARQTYAIAHESGGWDAADTMLESLYGGGVEGVLMAIAEHAARSATLLLVGHQPWCAQLVAALTGARVRMGTAAVAALEIGPSWDALDPGWCSLQWLSSPTALNALGVRG